MVMRWHYHILPKNLEVIMKFVKIFIILLLIPIQSVISADIEVFMDTLEQKLEWLNYRLNLEQWDHYTKGQADSLDFYQELYNDLTSNPEIYLQLQRDKKDISNEQDLRRWDILNSLFSSEDVGISHKISKLVDSLSSIEVNYRAIYNGEKKQANELYKIYRTSRNRGDRENAYRAYVSVGNKLAEGLSQLIRLRNQQAKKNGYSNYFSYSFKQQNLDIDEYEKLLERLDQLSQSPYQAILASVRNKLSYNELQIWDLGYFYADINRELDSYFPVESQLSFIKQGLKGIGVNIDKMPIYFDLESRDGKSQFAFTFPIKPPHDLRVMANLIEGHYSTRTLHHEIGHAIHYALISQDNNLFRTEQSGIWSEAMAQIFAGMCEERLWLEKYAKVPYAVARSFIKSKKEADIIYLRTQLMRLQFELQAYTNPNRDLNKLYWELFEKYLMLPKHEDLKPWASLFYYITHPVYMQNYLYADMVKAQTYAYLEKNYESVVDNKMTKAFLVQNYLRFGSRYPWDELLERGTEEGLNPNYYIQSLGL